MNVLVLIVDSLRQDYCYSAKTRTPTIEELQKDSLTFDQAISGASWTAPSMSSIFSGIYPHRLGMYNFAESYPEGVQTLFTALNNSGYEVGSFVFNDDVLFRNVPSANVVDDFRDYEKPKNWIKDHANDDFLLFIHHLWVHSPYEIPDSSEDWMHMNAKIHKRLRNDHAEAKDMCIKKYTSAIERMSENWLRGIIETLKNSGIYDDTLIVFTSDHGESWGSRYDDSDMISSNFHMHGKQIYDEHIHVPLIIKHPNSHIDNKSVGEQVRHIDIFPTITDILDINTQGKWKKDGRSLEPVFRNQDIDHRRAIISATGEEFQKIDKLALRNPKTKFIWNIPEDKIEMYDLESDPEESKNIAQRHPSIAKSLLSKLKDEYNKTPTEPIKLDEDAKDRLSDLGYR